MVSPTGDYGWSIAHNFCTQNCSGSAVFWRLLSPCLKSAHSIANFLHITKFIEVFFGRLFLLLLRLDFSIFTGSTNRCRHGTDFLVKTATALFFGFFSASLRSAFTISTMNTEWEPTCWRFSRCMASR